MLNKVQIIGRLGKDPEVRYMPSGSIITTCSVATSEKYKDSNGDKQEKTEWHKVVFFGRQAEVAGEYLRKGSLAYIEGKLQTRKWQDQEGNDRFSTEIVGSKMQMLGGHDGDYSQRQTSPAQQQHQQDKANGYQPDDSDVPF